MTLRTKVKLPVLNFHHHHQTNGPQFIRNLVLSVAPCQRWGACPSLYLWHKKTKTKQKKRNPRIHPNLLWASDSLSSSFTLVEKQKVSHRLDVVHVCSLPSVLHSFGSYVSPFMSVAVQMVCSLSAFQVAVTGAPPGQDPWGVIEDAHSLGASALLSHVGEKHLWWPALLQNRYVCFCCFFTKTAILCTFHSK